MFAKILVPLDGSAVAERALPAAVRLATAARAKLRLVMVHQRIPASALPAEVLAASKNPDRAIRKSEHQYLRGIAARLKEDTGLSVTSALLDGPVAETLATHIDETDVELVVMTTHGRGPVNRFWLGSIADRLVRTLRVPVLLLRGEEHDAWPPAHPRVLVPLDGSRLAEGALDPAARVARLLGGECILLQVVPPTALVQDGVIPTLPVAAAVPAEAQDLIKEAAAEYLAGRAARLEADGVPAATLVVPDFSVPTTIVREAEERRADLVALATHGAGGLRRLVLGSVADKVLRSTTIPLLVVRPRGRN